MVNTFKVERSQKFVWELPDGTCRLDPKSLKKLSERQINQNENLSKKLCFLYLKSGKEPNILIGATRRNLQARPKILKKISKHQINLSEPKFPKKKYV
jgi:hypothetical protein